MNMSLEKITYIIKGRCKVFEDAWNPFMVFLQKENNGDTLEEIIEDM